jgi:hypothetical protein
MDNDFLGTMTRLSFYESKKPTFTQIMTNLAIEESKKPSFTDVMTNLAIEQSKIKKPTFTEIMTDLAIQQSKEPKATLDAEMGFLQDLTHSNYMFEPFGVTFVRSATKFWKMKHN